jgi:hypothetical protein
MRSIRTARFATNSPAQESAALMRLVAPFRDRVLMHIDLHETTDTDESEFRPALAARDGIAYEPDEIPDGFYLVDDSENPQPDFQQAVIAAVAKVTHIAPADRHGEIIGSPMVAPGVIEYALAARSLRRHHPRAATRPPPRSIPTARGPRPSNATRRRWRRCVRRLILRWRRVHHFSRGRFDESCIRMCRDAGDSGSAGMHRSTG